MPDIQDKNSYCPGIPESKNPKRRDCKMTATKYNKDGVYYCMHCAVELGLREKTVPNSTRKKQSDAKKGDTSNENVDFIPKEVKDALNPTDFDLESQYALYKEIDRGHAFGNSAAILAYSQWYHADVGTRTPKNKEDVAKILDVSVPTLYRWEKMKIFMKARSEYLDDVLEYGLGAEITTAVALTKARSGSEKSIEIINRRVEKRQKERGTKRNPFDFLEPEDLAEAKDIMGDDSVSGKTQAGRFAKETIEDILVTGEPIDESKFN